MADTEESRNGHTPLTDGPEPVGSDPREEDGVGDDSERWTEMNDNPAPRDWTGEQLALYLIASESRGDNDE